MKSFIWSLIGFLVLAFVLLFFGVAHAATVCQTSARFGSCSFGSYSVSNDQWGSANGTNTLSATSYHDWDVQARNVSSGYAYPDVRRNIGYSSSLSSAFKISMPSGSYSAEAAYDLWSGSTETMIWVDNHGETPSGKDTGSVTIDGTKYQKWVTSNSDHTISYVRGNESSGTIPLGAILKNAGRGSLTSIQFGWEIHNSGGSKTFSLENFSS